MLTPLTRQYVEANHGQHSHNHEIGFFVVKEIKVLEFCFTRAYRVGNGFIM